MLTSYEDLPTAQNAKQDLVRIRIGDWLIRYNDAESLSGFAASLCPPPRVGDNFRRQMSHPIGTVLNTDDPSPDWGWIFRRKGNLEDSTKPINLTVRKQHPSVNVPHPLFEGKVTIYRDAHRGIEMPDGFGQSARMRLELKLNPSRFAQYQTPWESAAISETIAAIPLRRRPSAEYSLDGNDNYLIGKREEIYSEHTRWMDTLTSYFQMVFTEIDSEIRRSCSNNNLPLPIFQHNYSLTNIEEYWELSCENSLAELSRIAPTLRQFGQQMFETEYFSSEQNVNGRGFSIKLREGVRLKAYAKTNNRIRFEVAYATNKFQGIPHTSSDPNCFRDWSQEFAEEAAAPLANLFEMIRNDSEPPESERTLAEFLDKIMATKGDCRTMRKIINCLITSRMFVPITKEDARIVKNLKRRMLLQGSLRRGGASIVHLRYQRAFQDAFPPLS